MSPIDLRVCKFALSVREFTSVAFGLQVGVSNPGAKFFALRQKGLTLPCRIVTMRNRDGDPCRVGLFSLTAEDRKKIRAWLKE